MKFNKKREVKERKVLRFSDLTAAQFGFLAKKFKYFL